jgi:catechol 2,3-dioxygenase-like lactoylglutathione lyase family enzyme
MNPFAGYARVLVIFAAGFLVGGIVMRPASAQGNAAAGERVNHVGIAVKDFQQSLDFYTKVMGFRMAYAFPSPDGRPTTTFLQVNRDTFIEMAPATDKLPAGITHFGIWTDDANATVAQIRQNGGMPSDVRSGGPSGSQLSNITDPNGIRIEINQQPAGSFMRKAMDSWK